jgi:multiple sugar transport system permease protein
MMLPGVITALVFSFIMCWNEFTYALILTGEETRTLQLGLLATVGVRGVLWELMAATGMVVMIPMFILSFTIRKYFVEGLTMGAVK